MVRKTFVQDGVLIPLLPTGMAMVRKTLSVLRKTVAFSITRTRVLTLIQNFQTGRRSMQLVNPSRWVYERV